MNNELYGLVLAGGKSSRMKKDKASLRIHQEPQAVYCYKLLSKVCEKVFISARKDQEGALEHKDMPPIYDSPDLTGSGPIAGIISALREHPKRPWLVLACDLPFVNQEVLEKLINERNPQKKATAYKSSHDGLPEPLCTIFESHSLQSLLDYVAKDKNCPRKFLINSDIKLIEQPFPEALDNINTPDELNKALKKLGTEPN